MPEERLQKIISNAGKASRRVAESWITEGRVAVNGQIRQTLGARADPLKDEITVDGVPVEKSRYRYFALHKPKGFITTARDDRGRDTVVDLIPLGETVLHPVGRLDADSEGLVIMTNDGNLTNLLTHPRHGVEKEYLVAVNAPLSTADAQRAVRGLDIEGERLNLSAVHPTLPPAGEFEEIPDDSAWLLVTLRHGRKREIRRLMTALGRTVMLLRRIRVGPLALGSTGSGAFRELTPEEVEALYAAAGNTRALKSKPKPQQQVEPQPSPDSDLALPWAVAIDGPAASGKTTVGMALAERFGYQFLDTGLMYRALTYAALAGNVQAEDQEACTKFAENLAMEVLAGADTRIVIEGRDITDNLRSPDVEQHVSAYSAIPGVREALVSSQRAISAVKRSVLVGRDVGSTVLPDAPLKIYLDASESARADRRSRQSSSDVKVTADTSQQEIARRDSLDSNREASPLRAPDGAVLIDTTDLTLEQVVDRVAEEVLRCAKT